jgi:hypothetical protein
MSNPIHSPSEKNKADLTKKVMDAAADALLKFDPAAPVTIVYHNDTDGLTSGAIMRYALEKAGRQVIPYCMEQVYPVPLTKLYEITEGPVVFMDLGINDQKEEFIRSKTGDRPTVIIDHHGVFMENPKHPVGKDNVFDVNCNKYGIDGDKYASASTLTYMVANKIANISKIARLAVLGAFSDKNHMQGEEKGFFSVKGLDHKLLELSSDAKVDDGIFKMRLQNDTDFMLMDQLVQDITVLGSIGYRKRGSGLGIEALDAQVSGPDLGIQLLTQGYSEQVTTATAHLSKLKEAAYEAAINRLREKDFDLRDRIFFFDTRDLFAGMGVKTIGTFCDHLLNERFRNQMNFMEFNRYVMGAQLIEPIPFGESTIPAFEVEDVLKISVRTPFELKEMIDAGSSIDVLELLSKANPDQVGSSHRLRGATVIPREKVNEFLAKCDSLIKTRKTAPVKLPELDAGIES